MKTLLRTCIVLVSSLLAAQGQAVQINPGGQSRTESGSQKIGTGGLHKLTWTVSSFSRGRIVPGSETGGTDRLFDSFGTRDFIAYSGGTARNVRARLLGAGGMLAPPVTGHNLHQILEGGFRGLDDCLFARNCSVRKLRHAGESDHERPPVSGGFSDNSADEQHMPVKVETSLDSGHHTGCVDCQPTSVPEPSIVALLGLGLLLIFPGRYRLRPRLAARQRP